MDLLRLRTGYKNMKYLYPWMTKNYGMISVRTIKNIYFKTAARSNRNMSDLIINELNVYGITLLSQSSHVDF